MQTAETVPHAACDCLRQEASVCRLPQSLAGNDRLALAEPVAGCRTIAKASRTPAPPFQSGSQRTKSQRISIPHDSLRLTCDSLQLPHSSALPKYCKIPRKFRCLRKPAALSSCTPPTPPSFSELLYGNHHQHPTRQGSIHHAYTTCSNLGEPQNSATHNT